MEGLQGVGGGEIIEEFLGGGGVLGVFDEGDRIFDGGAVGDRYFKSHGDFLGMERIGFVDDAGIDVAGLDGGQRGADAFAGNDFGGDFVPDADFLQVFLRISMVRAAFQTWIVHLFYRFMVF